jgi:hypothetical protein
VPAIRCVTRKWPGQPHWEFDAPLLGDDDFGSWLGIPVGTHISRPGAEIVTDQPQVTLVPQAPYVATFHRRLGATSPVSLYVDITSVPSWDGDTVTCFDLDLDVLQGWGGRVWVDDEDEFADHRVRFGYPDELVALATSSCASVRAAVEATHAPYDGKSAEHWFGVLGE